MTIADVLTSWVAWPVWAGFGLLVLNGIIEHFDRRS